MFGHKIVLGMATTALLGSCSMMMGMGGTTYTFKHNPNAADPAAMGKAVAIRKDTMVSTTLTVSGLTPNKAYIAHYHAFGPASSTDPCASNGPVTLGFPSFTSDASGNASVTVSGDPAKIAGDMGAYINVHYASEPSVVPICAPVKMTKG
ncbi:CHRD domain-containing protein [Deinococcus sp. Arct2-2]|uniref:CHRD domain-containing protein n=1 Tax=Deinococcus sp. Arct2-2 TaxID=2568653 RepID=UPI0010A5482B|nr:CHRD domain-containing protein [Deinococcus sp. Arct2-2]THF68353.1 CHRD domain-containing protein [Deinococcus sp. Arct2-2]